MILKLDVTSEQFVKLDEFCKSKDDGKRSSIEHLNRGNYPCPMLSIVIEVREFFIIEGGEEPFPCPEV